VSDQPHADVPPPPSAPEPAKSSASKVVLIVLATVAGGLVLLVVVALVAALAVPTFLNQQDGAWTSAVESDLRNAAVAMETFYAENGHYGQEGVADPRHGFVAAPEVEIRTHVAADGQAFCLEGHHTSIDGPVAAYDSSAGGLEHDGYC
jgi:type IV pilus assembly protein PilA